jgi:HEAT repeat protein
MSFLQGLFGPPDARLMSAKHDIRGLEKVLTYQKDEDIRSYAAESLGSLKSVQSVEPFIAALKVFGNDVVRRAAAEALVKSVMSSLEHSIAGLIEAQAPQESLAE